MFRLNKTEQISLLDPINTLTVFQEKMLKKSWASYFREEIFPKIDEQKFSVLYSDKASRPNTPVNIMVGLLFIKELTRLTDNELMESLFFDLRFQYALHTTGEDKQPISRNMFTNFRNLLIAYEIDTGIDLLKEEVEHLAKELLKCVKSDKTLKRMDSLMISSRCKSLSRIDLAYKVNINFINAINDFDSSILTETEMKYLESNFKKEKIFETKKENASERLEELLNDSMTMYERYKDNKIINEFEEFKLLERLIKEQINPETNKPKASKEIKPSSLQNPSDPDATYRFKYENHVGYVGNVVEELTEKVILITDYDFQQNTYSDQQFMEDYIEKKNNNEEETIVVDAAYFSNELKNKAEEKGITLMPTQTMGVKTEKEIISEFKVDETNNEILACPNNEKPIEVKYNEKQKLLYAKFDKEKCKGCPLKEKCKDASIIKERVSSIQFTKSNYTTSTIRKDMKNEEYKKISDRRAGIEGTQSVFRRRYNVDNCPSFGLKRQKIQFGCAVMAINIKRMVKYSM